MKIILSFTILLCGFLVFFESSRATGKNFAIFASENSGQILPISATVIVKGQKIELEVAKTPQQQAIGLMFRESLAPNRGMLFYFEPPRYVSFWMKNVKFSLDMIFLRNGRIVWIAPAVPPCTSDPCPSYRPPVPVDGALELAGGRAAELGLQPGDRLQIEYFKPRR